MTENPDFTYAQALMSVESLPETTIPGNILLEAIAKIGRKEGVSADKICQDIAERVKMDAEEVRKRINGVLAPSHLHAVNS